MTSSSAPPIQIPRPKSSNTISDSQGSQVPLTSKTYTLNNVPRPTSKSSAPTSTETETNSDSQATENTKMASSTYQQRVAVPRKGDPQAISEHIATTTLGTPAAPASESMRIKLPTPPRTAEEYYAIAKAHSSSAANPLKPKASSNHDLAAPTTTSREAKSQVNNITEKAKSRGVGLESKSQESPTNYSQPVKVPRKNAPAVEAESSNAPAPASESMRIKLPPPPRTSEEYYERSRAEVAAAIPAEQNQSAKISSPAKMKTGDFPSLSSRYGLESRTSLESTKVTVQENKPQKLATMPVPDTHERSSTTVTKQEKLPLDAQQAIAEVTEVANDVVSAFGSSRTIHININAPIEVHIHQGKHQSKL